MDKINAISKIVKAIMYSKSNSMCINKKSNKVKVAKILWMPENTLLFYVDNCIHATLTGSLESAKKIIKIIKEENIFVDEKTIDSFPFLRDCCSYNNVNSKKSDSIIDILA
jgi:hypothetical protein